MAGCGAPALGKAGRLEMFLVDANTDGCQFASKALAVRLPGARFRFSQVASLAVMELCVGQATAGYRVDGHRLGPGSL